MFEDKRIGGTPIPDNVKNYQRNNDQSNDYCCTHVFAFFADYRTNRILTFYGM